MGMRGLCIDMHLCNANIYIVPCNAYIAKPVGSSGRSNSSPNNLDQMYSVENRDHSKTQAQPVFGLANLALN